MGYPVVAEQVLPPVRRRLLLGGRREPTDLPDLPPGAVYLFRLNGRYQRYGDDRHVDLADRTVIDATSVSVVQTRPWSVDADVAIPSMRASDDFTVRATFRCRVTRPELVAEGGYTNLGAVLANHLRQDRDLSGLGAQYRIDDVNTVRRRVDAQISAYCMLSPVVVRGMEIDLESVAVLTPNDLRQQARRIRDEEWGQEVKRSQRTFEDEDVRWLAGTLERGPAHADALGVARGQVNLSDVSIRAHEAEQERRKQLAAMAQSLAERGFFDRVPMDPTALLEAVTGGFGVTQSNDALGSTEQPPALTAPDKRGGRDSEDEPDFIPNEEDDD